MLQAEVKLGTWDHKSLAEMMVGKLNTKIQACTDRLNRLKRKRAQLHSARLSQRFDWTFSHDSEFFWLTWEGENPHAHTGEESTDSMMSMGSD